MKACSKDLRSKCIFGDLSDGSWLAGKPPNAFPQERMQSSFRGVVDVSPDLATVLEGLLEPVSEDRMPATEAISILSGQPQTASALRYLQSLFRPQITAFMQYTNINPQFQQLAKACNTLGRSGYGHTSFPFTFPGGKWALK